MRRIAVILAVVALGAAGCGNGAELTDDTTPDLGPPLGTELVIEDFEYSEISVQAGSTVDVANRDESDHTVTADDGSFDVTVPGRGNATFTAPAEPGEYSFTCTIHTGMGGSLTVT